MPESDGEKLVRSKNDSSSFLPVLSFELWLSAKENLEKKSIRNQSFFQSFRAYVINNIRLFMAKIVPQLYHFFLNYHWKT